MEIMSTNMLPDAKAYIKIIKLPLSPDCGWLMVAIASLVMYAVTASNASTEKDGIITSMITRVFLLRIPSCSLTCSAYKLHMYCIKQGKHSKCGEKFLTMEMITTI